VLPLQLQFNCNGSNDSRSRRMTNCRSFGIALVGANANVNALELARQDCRAINLRTVGQDPGVQRD
jgi:hypothetical protein